MDNTNRWMTSAMNESLATSRSDLGDWKKFCLNLTNIAVPSLIANDLVIVHPMTSYSGSVAYLKYVSKTAKGGVAIGDEFNGVFGLGKMTDARVNFTSQAVVEQIDSTGGITFAWTPVVYSKAEDIRVLVSGAYVPVPEAKLVKDAAGNVTGIAASYMAEGTNVAYKYNQEYTPANDIPTIGPKMEHIALVAEPRRIAVKYDQITAFQAKTDYGFSLDKQIAEQACGELAYEIDTDIVDMLYAGCSDTEKIADWSKTLPVGVNNYCYFA